MAVFSMLTFAQFFGFLVAAVLITASPGPDNLMILSMGISKGRKQGIIFGLGCALGCLSHTVLAVIGVSAIIAASPIAFTALKIAGGLYLIWLGINALRSRGGAKVEKVLNDEQALTKLFFKGVFANAINPKVVLFFSILPASVHHPIQRKHQLADGRAGSHFHRASGSTFWAARLLFGITWAMAQH